MNLSPLVFFPFAALAIGLALFVVLKRNPVSNAFGLVGVLFCMAAIYAGMGAHFVAALQVLVYTGAVMVLFVFVIMLLHADVPSLDFGKSSPITRVLASVLGVGIIAIFVYVFRNSDLSQIKGAFSVEAIEANGGNIEVLSEVLFSDYILPFELTFVLLLGAIVGSVAIAMRKKNPLRGMHQ